MFAWFHKLLALIGLKRKPKVVEPEAPYKISILPAEGHQGSSKPDLVKRFPDSWQPGGKEQMENRLLRRDPRMGMSTPVIRPYQESARKSYDERQYERAARPSYDERRDLVEQQRRHAEAVQAQSNSHFVTGLTAGGLFTAANNHDRAQDQEIQTEAEDTSPSPHFTSDYESLRKDANVPPDDVWGKPSVVVQDESPRYEPAPSPSYTYESPSPSPSPSYDSGSSSSSYDSSPSPSPSPSPSSDW